MGDAATRWTSLAPADANQPLAAAGDLADRLKSLGPADLPAFIARLQQLRLSIDRHHCPNLLEQLAAVVQGQPIEAVLINALDADTAADLSAGTLARWPIETAVGAATLARLAGGVDALTLVDAASPGAGQPLEEYRTGAAALGVRTEAMDNPYPQGDPTLLVYTLVGRSLPPGRLPTEAGVLIVDPPAAMLIGQLLLHPNDTSPPTMPAMIHDLVHGGTHRFVVPWGMQAGKLLAALPTPVSEPIGLRGGDLLRDVAVPPSFALGPGELILHVTPGDPHHRADADPCVRCGWCLDVCPTHVHPAGLLDAAQRQDAAMARRFGRTSCIECGLCTYVCPSKLPLLAAIRTLHL